MVAGVPGLSASPTRRVLLRNLLGGVLGITALTGCEIDDLRPPDADQPPPEPTASESSEPDPDADLVATVATAIITAAMAVERARLVPGLRRRLRPIAAMHTEHLTALDQTWEGPMPTGSPASAQAGLRQVRVAERRLRTTLVDASLSAQSAALARVLASAAASITQHLIALEGS